MYVNTMNDGYPKTLNMGLWVMRVLRAMREGEEGGEGLGLGDRGEYVYPLGGCFCV